MIEDFPPRLNSLGQDFQLAQPDGANVAHPVIVTNGRVLVVVLHRGLGAQVAGRIDEGLVLRAKEPPEVVMILLPLKP